MNRIIVLMFVFVFFTASWFVWAEPVSEAPLIEDYWVSKAPMNVARGGLGVAVVNGKIYAIGGSTASGPYPPDAFAGGFVGTNEEYDPATDTWTYKASMPTPRTQFAIAAYQNKIYCIGGAVGFSVDERSGFHSYITSGVNEMYDTVMDTWVTKAPMPDEGMKIQAHVVNGKIYVLDWSYMYIYDPANDTWSLKTQMPPPYPHSSPVSVVVGNKIIVTAEFQTGYRFRPEQKILIYDTETDSWSGGKSGPTVVVEGAAGATIGVKAPQRVYVLGLVAEQPRPLSANQVYDPETDSWATVTAMPTNRTDFGVVVINDILYAIGGYPHSAYEVTPTGLNDQYIPIGYGTVKPEVSVISPENNQVYNSSSVSLNFTVDRSVSWLRYSLDGRNNVTIVDNTTIAELPNGSHNLTVYVEDTFGNVGASETVNFTVKSPELFPTALVAIGITSAAVVGIGMLIYFKKRHH